MVLGPWHGTAIAVKRRRNDHRFVVAGWQVRPLLYEFTYFFVYYGSSTVTDLIKRELKGSFGYNNRSRHAGYCSTASRFADRSSSKSRAASSGEKLSSNSTPRPRDGGSTFSVIPNCE